MTLKEKLLKLIEFDEWEFHLEALKMGYDSNSPREHKAFEYGAKSLDSKLRPLLLALIECVEALEIMKQVAPKYHCDECEAIVRDMDTNIYCNCGARTAHSALARLSEIVEKSSPATHSQNMSQNSEKSDT